MEEGSGKRSFFLQESLNVFARSNRLALTLLSLSYLTEFERSMAKNSAAISKSLVRQLLDLCLNSDRITRQEYLQLTTVVLSNRNVTLEDLHQINRIFDRVQQGRIKLIDERP